MFRLASKSLILARKAEVPLIAAGVFAAGGSGGSGSSQRPTEDESHGVHLNYTDADLARDRAADRRLTAAKVAQDCVQHNGYGKYSTLSA